MEISLLQLQLRGIEGYNKSLNYYYVFIYVTRFENKNLEWKI